MYDRRQFLGMLSLPALASIAPPRPRRVREVLGRANAAASDEGYWSEIARAFTIDRSITNLNNGGVSPSPAYVQEAHKRNLDFSNNAPPYSMWRILEPQRDVLGYGARGAGGSIPGHATLIFDMEMFQLDTDV